MSGVELSGKVVELVGEKVSVAVHRDVDVRVTEVGLDHLRVHTTTDEHGLVSRAGSRCRPQRLGEWGGSRPNAYTDCLFDLQRAR